MELNDIDEFTHEKLLDRAMNGGFPELMGRGQVTNSPETNNDLEVMVGRSVRLPVELDREIKKIAASKGQSVSDLLRAWVIAGVAAGKVLEGSVAVQTSQTSATHEATPTEAEPATYEAPQRNQIHPSVVSAAAVALRRKNPVVGRALRARKAVSSDIVARYLAGKSIRELAKSTGRSYGFIHRILTEAGVPLRQRGYANKVVAKRSGRRPY